MYVRKEITAQRRHTYPLVYKKPVCAASTLGEIVEEQFIHVKI